VGLVAQRRAISALRGRQHTERLSDDLDEVASLTAADAGQREDGPEARTASRDLLDKILTRLQATLSPLGLEIFYRTVVHDEPVEEAAAALGITPNAVYVWRSRLGTLVRKLAAELENPGSAPGSGSVPINGAALVLLFLLGTARGGVGTVDLGTDSNGGGRADDERGSSIHDRGQVRPARGEHETRLFQVPPS
jgi:hypothetical protein